MQFIRVASFFLALMSFGMIAFAAPSQGEAEVVKRSNQDVADALNACLTTVTTLCASINALLVLGPISVTALTPLVTSITAALDLCVSVIVTLSAGGAGPSISACITILINIIILISATLAACVTANPACITVVASVDVHVVAAINALDACLGGVISVVAAACLNVTVDANIHTCGWANCISLLGL